MFQIKAYTGFRFLLIFRKFQMMNAVEFEIDANDRPKFFIVHRIQLEQLLEVCHSCRRLPQEIVKDDQLQLKPVGKHYRKRVITWSQSSTNFTAVTRCTCTNHGRLHDRHYHLSRLSACENEI